MFANDHDARWPRGRVNMNLRRFIFWDYSRETTVYVVFCLLIVAFIFLTPKAWFEKRDLLATQTSRLIVQKKDFSSDRSLLETRVRILSGRPEAQIVSMREFKDDDGEEFYEVDIR